VRRLLRRRGRAAAIGVAFSIGCFSIGGLPIPVAAGPPANCTFTTAAVLFGSYDVLATSPLYGTGSISGHCNRNDPVTIALSGGDSGTTSQRYMKSASSDTLNYNLYQTSAYALIWGTGASALTATFGMTQTTLTIYGMIPAQQDVSAGSYSDSIVATISY